MSFSNVTLRNDLRFLALKEVINRHSENFYEQVRNVNNHTIWKIPLLGFLIMISLNTSVG